jgi:hypothetical protein
MIDFELEDTDGHHRRLSGFRGRPVVLVVAGGPSREAAVETGARLAPRLGDTDAVVVAVADMLGVTRLARGIVRSAVRAGMRQAHVEAARQVPEMPPDAWDRFTLLLDWDGVALDALGLRGQTDRFHVLVLDCQGRERAHQVQGDATTDELVEAVVRQVSDL